MSTETIEIIFGVIGAIVLFFLAVYFVSSPELANYYLPEDIHEIEEGKDYISFDCHVGLRKGKTPTIYHIDKVDKDNDVLIVKEMHEGTLIKTSEYTFESFIKQLK